MLKTIGMLVGELRQAGLHDRVPALEDQARLMIAGVEQAGLLEEDVEHVRRAAHRAGLHAAAGAGRYGT